jgi:hypothetical protein
MSSAEPIRCPSRNTHVLPRHRVAHRCVNTGITTFANVGCTPHVAHEAGESLISSKDLGSPHWLPNPVTRQGRLIDDD